MESKIDKALQHLLKLGVEAKTLWTNSKPGSNFAAQTLTLTGGSKYDAILAECLPGVNDSTDINGTLVPILIIKNHKNYLNYIAKTDTEETVAEMRSRSIKFANGNVTFAKAYGFSIASVSRSVRLDYIIPIRIIGIKLLGGGYSLIRKIKQLFANIGRRCFIWQY